MTRIAILSDIHANVVALDAVLAALPAHRPDHVVCLGDVAATGPRPREVVARLRERGWPVVRGNCDEAMIAAADTDADPAAADDEHDAIDRWCAREIGPDGIAYLRTFAATVTIPTDAGDLLCYHGSPRSNLDEILPETPEETLAEWLGDDAAIYAGGHTHVPMVRPFRGAWVINPGSVGLPFRLTAGGEAYNPCWAEYAVVTVAGGRCAVELARVPVDRAAILASAGESDMPHRDWWTGDWR